MDAIKVIEAIAKRENVSVEYVKKELDKAISQGISNPNSIVGIEWQDLAGENGVLTPEDIVQFEINKLKRD